MGRQTCCPKQKLRKGLWSPEEDEKLCNYIARHGVGCWSSTPKLAGLQRCGKSCRLRWINYLRPDLKRGMFSQEEEDLIVELHKSLGNRWAQIAAQLPGRTDNEIKNFWNSCLKKKLMKQGIDPATHEIVTVTEEESRGEKESSQKFSSLPPPPLMPVIKAEQPFSVNYSSFMDHGRPIFDIMVDFQAGFDPISSCNPATLMMTQQQYHQNFSPDGHLQFQFQFQPASASQGVSVLEFDNGAASLAEADFSDNSTTMVSSILFSEAKESSSSSTNINSSAISWDMGKNNTESSLFQYYHQMNNGIKIEQDQEAIPWQGEEEIFVQNLDDFSYMFQHM
ncbi:hypothetical protein Dimus_004701 [Dionaea muscipula]